MRRLVNVALCSSMLWVGAGCGSDSLVTGPSVTVGLGDADAGLSDVQADDVSLVDAVANDSTTVEDTSAPDAALTDTVDVAVAADADDGSTSDTDAVSPPDAASPTCPGAVGCTCGSDADCPGAACVQGLCGVPGCTPSVPPVEACDGVDDDCDGQTDEDTCDDGEVCTLDSCDGSKCTSSPTTAPCDADGDACTEDVCFGGTCVASKTKDCDDGSPCTEESCDPLSGQCVTTPTASTATCDDGNACTKDDACDKGACAGSGLDCDDDNPCTKDSCDPTSGCVQTPTTGPCDDGDACTLGDACEVASGKCVAGSSKDCDDNNPCTKDSCEALSGGCVQVGTAAACDDGNKCSVEDTCDGLTCVGKPLNCDDGNPCTKDSCDSGAGCVHKKTTSPCDDNNPCTVFDTCVQGKCLGLQAGQKCDDSNPCTQDSCDAQSGCINLPTQASCTDGDACTQDACENGACVAVKFICGCVNDAECAAQDDANLCNGKLKCVFSEGKGLCKVDPASIVTCDTSGDGPCQSTTCDANTGKCGAVNASDGTACDADGSVCTVGDSCKAGACTPGKVQGCDDSNPCTDDQCDATNGCVFLPNEATCDADNDPCTNGDVCKNTLCVKGPAVPCDDGNPCTADSCDSSLGGCTYKAAPNDGKACDADGSVCTVKDACQGGKCIAGAAVNCDDKNPCTDDQCDPTSGCVYGANAVPCDADGDPCTAGDTCTDKVCKAGPPKTCDDGKKCTKDSCEAKTGVCKHENIVGCGGFCNSNADCEDNNGCTNDQCKNAKCEWTPVAGSCDDGSLCTDQDSCQGGVCVGLKKNCDDGNPCTNDGCVPGTGCVNLNNAAPCDDFDQCTLGDICASGACVSGKSKPCDDGDDCTTNKCNPATGECLFKGIPGCGGYCASVTDCDDKNPCTAESCVQGKCSSTLASGPCEDGDLCTTPDACANGKCAPGPTLQCDDKDPCTVDSCDPKTGKCGAQPGAVGTPCDDGDVCSSKDSCQTANGALTCKGGVATCDDGNACTVDTCDAGSGKCSHKTTTGPCEDGNPCTTGDTCVGGVCTAVQDVFVTTLAGGSAGYKDGKPGQFNAPYGVTVRGDAVVVADTTNHRIRLIDKAGNVSTLAGSGNAGLLNAQGTSAWFNSPRGLDADGAGVVYVADTKNHVIRAIALDNQVTIVAGSAIAGSTNGPVSTARFNAPNDVAVTANGSTVYVADTNNNRIRRISGGIVSTLAGSSYGFANGNGAAARFRSPLGVALMSNGDVLIADSNNHRVRRATSAGVVTTFAGSGAAGWLNGGAATARFNRPYSLAVRSDGRVFVSDRYNHRVRQIQAGVVLDYAGTGKAGSADGGSKVATLNYPTATAINPQGELMVSSATSHRIRKVTDARNPCSIGGACWAEGVVNPAAACQTCVSKTSTTQWTASADGATCDDSDACTTSDQCAAGKCIGAPKGCDDLDKCTLDACDSGTGLCSHTPIIGCGGNCKQVSDCDDKNPCTDDACTSGKCAFSANTKACDDGEACTWGDVCKDGKCAPGSRTEVSTYTGLSAGYADGALTSARFRYPRAVEAHPQGGFVIADGHNHRLRRVSATGQVSTIAGSSAGFANGSGAAARFYYPTDVAIRPSGVIVVADYANHRVRSVDTKGTVTTLAGGAAGYLDGPGTTARFNAPMGVALSKGGVAYVAEYNNHRIRRVTQDGAVTTLAGSNAGFSNGQGSQARFYHPIGITVARDGGVLVADYSNNRIRRVSPNGLVTTIAGTGTAGIFNGAASTAQFNRPWGIVELSDGTVVVADRYNNRLRRISPSGQVSTLAGTGFAGAVDGDALTTARFREPWGLAATATGLLYVADYQTHRIRRVRVTENACNIGGVCYANNTKNPASSCQVCSGAAQTKSWTTSLDGQPCEDGAYCTLKDTCKAGKCAAGAPPSCDDNNACSADSCDPGTGACMYKAIQGCDGWCFVDKDCEDGNPCVTDTCLGASENKPGTCKHANNLLACDDGQACTKGDQCKDGKCQNGAAGWVETAAGSTAGYVNGAVSAARFNQPHGGVAQSDGSVVFADRYNQKIRLIKAGKVSLLAGSSAGYLNGPSTSARFNDPVDVATGPNQAIAVADRGNHRIRMISATGNVTTLAGSSAGFVDGKGGSARFYNPYGIGSTSAGVLYVADYSNHRIRRVTPDGMVITVAGSSAGFVDGPAAAAKFTAPIDVTALPTGDLVVSEYSGHRLRLVTKAGVVSLLAGTGQAGYKDGAGTSARFNYPRGLAWHPQGYVIVADQNNHLIRAVTLKGEVSTLAGSSAGWVDGLASSARFNSPRGVAVTADGKIWVGDVSNHRVRTVRPTAESCLIGGACWAKGTGETPCKVCEGAKSPTSWSVVADGGACDDGQLCTDNDSCKAGSCAGVVSKCDDNDACTKDACDSGTGACVHTNIIGCNGYCETNAHCSDGNPCTLGEVCSNNKCSFGATTFVDTTAGSGAGFVDGPAAGAKFNNPRGVAVDASGQIWVSDHSNHRIRRVAVDGTVSTVAGSGKAGLVDGAGTSAWFNGPEGLAIDAKGNVWVADRYTHSIRTIDGNLKVTTVAGNGAAGYVDDFGAAARFNNPVGLTVSPGGTVFVADCYNHRIRRVEPDSTVQTVSGIGLGYKDGDVAVARFNYPTGVALGADGMLFVADYGNNRIRKVTPDGTVTTIAGSGTAGGLDGAATSAQFYQPRSIVVDTAQRIFVAERGGHRVRRVSDGLVERVAGSSAGYVDGAWNVARFNLPSGLAVSAGGTLYLGEDGNDRIRRVRITAGACSIGGACYAEGSRDPKQPCSACQKSAKTWSAIADGVVCDDNSPCTLSDSCKAGSCVAGTTKLCDDNNGCTTDACDVVTGACVFKPSFDPNCKP